jgi:hypothetical protein
MYNGNWNSPHPFDAGFDFAPDNCWDAGVLRYASTTLSYFDFSLVSMGWEVE